MWRGASVRRLDAEGTVGSFVRGSNFGKPGQVQEGGAAVVHGHGRTCEGGVSAGEEGRVRWDGGVPVHLRRGGYVCSEGGLMTSPPRRNYTIEGEQVCLSYDKGTMLRKGSAFH